MSMQEGALVLSQLTLHLVIRCDSFVEILLTVIGATEHR